VVHYNEPHNKKYITSANIVSATMYNGVDVVTQYFNLAYVNQELARENAMLRNKIVPFEAERFLVVDTVKDTIIKQQYVHRFAKVINSSINRQKNFLTINIGEKDGVEKDMAVISSNGIVGIIYGTSEHYSSVMSVLNIDYKVSARIKKNNYFGSLI